MLWVSILPLSTKGRRGHDRVVVKFTIAYAISAYHHLHCDIPVSSTNKSYRHDITEILLQLALITITLAPLSTIFSLYFGPISSKWYVLFSFYFSRRHFLCQKRAKTCSKIFSHSRGILPLDSTGARKTLWWLYSSCKI